ncbi:hypothetical protein GUJ93_ZPchr0010g8270 [Zizania palustris]|uniref:Uncharacterized protein n=1 Tax=Zizania palustris TaxID=103762 RepID=A0A8J5WBU2_ZIZPA|nr:hypothetical protein GUJ93_ZPchr0217g6460 [Zizania palustris]KAG8086479.1 hypothetical protein GUJ93_ZPchr0010g8270 [Zizania palustris]
MVNWLVIKRSNEAIAMGAKVVVEDRRRAWAWDCGSPLYDSFELASVYGVLDRHLMTLPFAKRSAAPDTDTTRERAPARRTAARAKEQRRRKAAAARRTGNAVLRSIFRSVTCSRRL